MMLCNPHTTCTCHMHVLQSSSGSFHVFSVAGDGHGAAVAHDVSSRADRITAESSLLDCETDDVLANLCHLAHDALGPFHRREVDGVAERAPRAGRALVHGLELVARHGERVERVVVQLRQ
jgi:hypothetical protein